MAVVAFRDEQEIGRAISAALASDDPKAAMARYLAPGLEWDAPVHSEVREVEAREGGVLVGLRWPAAATDEMDRWHALRIVDGRVCDLADFGLREDAVAYLGLTS